MAKQKTKLKEFFEGRRRQCELQVINVLKNKAGERRIKMSVIMPLSGQPVTGMPDIFTEPYMLMQKEKSTLNFSKIDVAVNEAAFNIFSTDTIKSAAVSTNGTLLQGFRMIGEGSDDKRTVSLEFIVYTGYTMALRDWGCDHIHSEFWAEVAPSQMELAEEAPAPAKKGKKKADELVQ